MSIHYEVNEQGAIPDLLAVSEAAALLRVGLTFAYASTARFIATGSDKEIPAIKVGRLTRVPRAAFERFVGAPITWPIPEVGRPAAARPDSPSAESVSPSSAASGGSSVPPFSGPASPARLFEA